MTDRMKQYEAEFCRAGCVPQPVFAAVSSAARRQNQREMSPESGTPVAATKPNRWPHQELRAAAHASAPTKLQKRRAPEGYVTKCRQPTQHNRSRPINDQGPVAARLSLSTSPQQKFVA